MMDSHFTSLVSVDPDFAISSLRTAGDHREGQRTKARQPQGQSKEDLHYGHKSSGKLMMFH